MSRPLLAMNTPTHTDLEAPAWAAVATDPAEDLDEPPEIRLQQPSPHRFQRTAVRHPSAQSSLLTKAIMGYSDEDSHACVPTTTAADKQRRRSMASNVSVASTADLTSDTGLTSPCRTNTPSPPIPELISMCLDAEISDNKPAPLVIANAPEPPRRRCIQFACAAKPPQQDQPVTRPAPVARVSSAQEPPRRPCIKFTYPSASDTARDAPAGPVHTPAPRLPPANKVDLSTSRKSTACPAPPTAPSQPMSLRRPSSKNTLARPKFLRANSKDLTKDSSQFHEFASGTTREEEWLRRDVPVITTKLTINDTLTKENHIRRLGAEAEEEALEEEEAEAETGDGDLDELDGDDDDQEDEDEDDGEEEDDEASDGYYTDEETGFADSDDEEDDDENMRLWTPSHATTLRQRFSMVPARRPSLHEPQSDSSAATNGSIRRVKTKRAKPSSDTPDLPDSTDFVCGTLDEDRPLEEAYLSCLAARRNGKLRIIPQDIDPSFPASDPDDDEEDIYNPVAHDSDTDVMVHGEMEDLHHGQERSRRRRKSDVASPRKYRSPAPKRHHSPPPKSRTRSPKTLFGRQSPRRARSPAPRALTTPAGSPRQGAHVQFHLAGRPNTTHTKSLPRPAALFPHLKKERNAKYHHESDLHLRGAIDIFKGLERKRQRRKEKYYQKYCNRARRGQIPERKPQPGRGAERMKELGLLMAGKKEQGNYVLSI